MSLFTIFHSREFTVIDPGWHRLVSASGARPPSRRQLVKTERDGEPLAGRRSSLAHSAAPLLQQPLPTFSGRRQRLRSSHGGSETRASGLRVPGAAADSGWDALRLASRGRAPRARPRLPGGFAAGARGQPPGSRWCASGGCWGGELFLIVQVPVGAVVKQLREGVRKSRSQREGGREGEPRQRGRGRERKRCWRRRDSWISERRMERRRQLRTHWKAVDTPREGHFNSVFLFFLWLGYLKSEFRMKCSAFWFSAHWHSFDTYSRIDVSQWKFNQIHSWSVQMWRKMKSGASVGITMDDLTV